MNLIEKIHIVRSEEGDWEGLYINGILMCEGHSLSIYDIFKALFVKYDTITIPLEGHLPNELRKLNDFLAKE